MRGSLEYVQRLDAPLGIIPAHAGLTRWRSLLQIALWDHPRACGAHVHKDLCSLYFSGSSPRMRGSRQDDAARVVLVGIIPAHAGLTAS